MAFGADRGDVFRLVVGRGLLLTLAGLGLGLIVAFALSRTVASLLFGVTPTDPLTFVAISLLLLGVSLVACSLPAHRAARMDPMDSLRYEPIG